METPNGTMTSRRKLHLIVLTVLAGCEANVDGWTKEDPGGTDDVHDALAALPNAEVLEWTPDGLPTYIVGEMMKVGAMQSDDPIASDSALRDQLTPVLAAFRLHTTDLVLKKMNVDDSGDRHFRYSQMFNGLPVIGGDLVVHVDVKGAVYSVNGTARGDIPPSMGATMISEAQAKSAIAGDGRFAGLTTTASRLVYIEADGAMHKAYEATVEGMRGVNPARDKVYV
ncbi:MAG TPA: hypothetical protein VLB44_21320, partial [Kofleriaceae bacterium]|nr:hypothetical protein [Kofleriaceae bacterium]